MAVWLIGVMDYGWCIGWMASIFEEEDDDYGGNGIAQALAVCVRSLKSFRLYLMCSAAVLVFSVVR